MPRPSSSDRLERTLLGSLPTILKWRRLLIVALHLGLVAAASYGAFWLRFDGAIPPLEWALMLQTLPVLLAIRGVIFVPFRLYEGLWRYTSIWDLRRILLGVVLSTMLFYAFVHGFAGEVAYPRSVFILDSLLLISLMCGIRLTRRVAHEFSRPKLGKRVLVFGAGDAGEMIVRDMLRNAAYAYQPLGFVDDDPNKIGQRIHGLAVLGGREALPEILERHRPEEVLIAIPTAGPAAMRGIVKALEQYKIRITTLPNLSDVFNGSVTVSQIRRLSIEDLLPRAPVGLGVERLRELVANRRVLVTGAGGSIGSELCRQIAALDAEVLVLFERYENSLYQIINVLEDAGHGSRIRPAIGDITDAERLDQVLAEYRPHLIFHAAAHKHVPLMELNICEAVKNNVIGTRRVAEAAERHGVEKMVLISTDKAVRPSSIMGATKRVAELIVSAQSSRSATCFAAVRFGNVLGSNGSVVPRFLQQIEAGGPVTVTHPEMRRYFMLIPEAVHLVLHAAAQAREHAVYVLDMGDQISLLDMARNLIRLAGFVPEKEIPIAFSGLRPGEKLSEQLVDIGEAVEASRVARVLRVRPTVHLTPADLAWHLRELERCALAADEDGVLRQLRRLVPTFARPQDSIGEPGHPDLASPVVEDLSGSFFHMAASSGPVGRSVERSFRDRRRPGQRDRRESRRGGRRFYDQIDVDIAVAVAPAATPEALEPRL